jgi:hypothetical protein
MRVALRSAPLLLIGVALVGCGKDSGGTTGSASQPIAKLDTSKPSVLLKIPSMH